MNRSHRWKALLARTLIGLVAFPTGLLSGVGAAAASGGALHLVEVSPSEDWVELHNGGAEPVAAGTEITLSASGETVTVLVPVEVPAGDVVVFREINLNPISDTLSVNGSTALSWGSGRTALVPAPETGNAIVKAGMSWVSNVEGTPGELVDVSPVPQHPTRLTIEATEENPTDTITRAIQDDVRVKFDGADDASFYRALIIDRLNAMTELEQSTAFTSVSNIDASALVDGAVTLRGYTVESNHYSAWQSASGTKVTTAATPVVTVPTEATWTNETSAVIRGTVSTPGTVALYRNSATGTPLDTAEATETFTFTAPILANSANTFVVMLTDSWGNPSEPVSVPTITHDAIAPAAPLNLTATQTDEQRAHLSWAASTSTDIANYRIYTGGATGNVLVATVPAGDLAYTTAPLATGTYHYAVAAVDRAGNQSALSPIAHVTITAQQVAAIAAPTNVTVIAENGQIRLRWTPVDQAAGYLVRYRVAGSNDSYTTVFLSGATHQEYLVKGLQNGTRYELGVAAQSTTGATSAFVTGEQTPIAPQVVTPAATQSSPAVTTAAAPRTTRVVRDAIGGQVGPIDGRDVTRADEKTDEQKQDEQNGTAGDTSDDATDGNEEDNNQSLITFLIIVLAAAAGFGGYYGYQWWVASPDETGTPTEPAERPKSTKKPERGGRW